MSSAKSQVRLRAEARGRQRRQPPPAAGGRGQAPGADSGHLPAHYQFYCVGNDTVQSQGEAGSWKAKQLTVSGLCLGRLARSRSH